MTTFDDIIPRLENVFRRFQHAVQVLVPMVINRDLNGRVRLIVEEARAQDESAVLSLKEIAEAVSDALGPHGFPAEHAVLVEQDVAQLLRETANFQLSDLDGVYVVDRLAASSDWLTIEPQASAVPRVVFFSIKGGVGRSTALAASAWSLAQQGKRVLVVDLDLESPGLSTALLPNERRPGFGVTDWLVENLVGNGDAVLADMVATSTLSHDGEIFVVPAHGKEPGEYVSKLGRVWMPSVDDKGVSKPWSQRLCELISRLEERLRPDVVLIDSRAGIDEVASACVTDLGARLVLLFALDGEQTWSGYRILFSHWNKAGVANGIRERLQMVGAMLPELDTTNYYQGLLEQAWNLFTEQLYDEVPAGESGGDYWSFDVSEDSAPHTPWPVRWHRGFAALRSLHARMDGIDPDEVDGIFGRLIAELADATNVSGETE